MLDEPTGPDTNYLLVGSDSHENLDPEAPDAAEPSVTGEHADTIILLRVGPDGALMMSIPRSVGHRPRRTRPRDGSTAPSTTGPATSWLR